MKNLLQISSLFYLGIGIILSFFSCEKDDPSNNGSYGTIYDIDGNQYKIDTFGNDIWMIENLKVTVYRNGSKIPNVENFDEWNALFKGAYCIYDNNSGLIDKYGRLYNWYAVNDTNGLAPVGWHVATKDDWVNLINFLGNNTEGKKKFEDPNGFAVQLGGRRLEKEFTLINDIAYYWTSTKSGVSALTFAHNKYGSNITINPNYTSSAPPRDGNSVRCVKDK